MECEYQLGKRGLFPNLGGSMYQKVAGDQFEDKNFNEISKIGNIHMNAFNWIMHLADGKFSNLEISKKSRNISGNNK